MVEDTQEKTAEAAPSEEAEFDAIWREGIEDLQGARANPFDLPPILHKDAVASDLYDQSLWDDVLGSAPGLSGDVPKHKSAVPTADALAMDLFHSVLKDSPRMRAQEEMDPGYLCDRELMDQVVDSPEWHALRAQGTVGDELSSAIAARVLLDRLVRSLDGKTKAKIKQAHQASAKAGEERANAEEQAEQAANAADQAQQAQEEGATPEELDELAQRLAQMRAAADAARARAEESAADAQAIGQGAQEAIDKQGAKIRAAVRQGTEEAGKDVQDATTALSLMGGTGHGRGRGGAAKNKAQILQRMLADKKLRLIAEVGRLQLAKAMFYQSRKVTDEPEDVHDVIQGNDLSLVLPSEIIRFLDPVQRPLFLRDFINEDLLMIKMRGKKRTKRGPIIIARDNSSSMCAEFLWDATREIWCKGLSLVFMKVALAQHRDVIVIDYDDAETAAECKIWRFPKEGYDAEEVLESCLWFTQGGTSYEGWMQAALDALEEDAFKKADVIHISDGEAYLSSEVIDRWAKVKAQKGFRCYSILCGPGYGWRAERSVLHTFSDEVTAVSDLETAEEAMSKVFSI